MAETTPTSTPVSREDAQKQILNRLNRARGQLNGVIAAVEAGKSCRDVVTQLSAVSSALNKAGFAVVASAMTFCVADGANGTDGSAAQAGAGEERPVTLAELEKVFLMLS